MMARFLLKVHFPNSEWVCAWFFARINGGISLECFNEARIHHGGAAISSTEMGGTNSSVTVTWGPGFFTGKRLKTKPYI
jgi:hypothetical protein